ncbi:MAG: DUF1579 family protein [Planctomycetes bacterium]|nr:DUF1579 family protein [Planctomycetota bacterium]
MFRPRFPSRSFALPIAALCWFAWPLSAQDEPQGVPSPKCDEHAPLAELAGTWHSTVRMAAMPGVPGMEEAMEAEGIERAALVCDGMWLVWSSEGEMQGETFGGVWLAGYDPFEKRYVSVWVDNHQCTPAEMIGSYDSDGHVWTWHGRNAQGTMRSVLTWKDRDTMVETAWFTPPGGAEIQTMQATRRRLTEPPPAAAVATPRGGELPAALRELHRGIGSWDATLRMQVDPSAPATEERCREVVRAVCCGQYTWSDFSGTMMGMPFEGHALVGWDAPNEQFVCYWVDSFSATWSKTAGPFDADAGGLTLSGTCRGPDGAPMTMREELSWRDADRRECRMTFESAGATQSMTLTYRRAAGR